MNKQYQKLGQASSISGILFPLSASPYSTLLLKSALSGQITFSQAVSSSRAFIQDHHSLFTATGIQALTTTLASSPKLSAVLWMALSYLLWTHSLPARLRLLQQSRCLQGTATLQFDGDAAIALSIFKHKVNSNLYPDPSSNTSLQSLMDYTQTDFGSRLFRRYTLIYGSLVSYLFVHFISFFSL